MSARRLLALLTCVVVVLGAIGYVALQAVPSGTASSPSRPRARANPSTTPGTEPVAPVAPAETAAPAPSCVPDASLGQAPQPAPTDLAAALAQLVADPRVAPHAVSLSVWIDGYGEVLAHEADRALAPASNQKLFTAMGALAVLGPDARLTTALRLTPAGDLVVVGGGDPTVTSSGPHSLSALAAQAQAQGITAVSGSLLVDESRHDGLRRAPGWQDWQIPTHTGPLSAFMVDDNRWRGDPGYLADPALGNAEELRGALSARGISIAGPTAYGSGAGGSTIASITSAPVVELVGAMLRASDNQIADLLLKEVGANASAPGALAAGAAATGDALAPLCLSLAGVTDDGSGLSRGNARSAREWRTLLHAARTAPWWTQLYEALPIAGRTGTLSGRLRGTPAENTVRAKTGTIIGGAALTGTGTTLSGRAFVFSVVVNGPGGEQAAGAIDTFVAAIAGHAA